MNAALLHRIADRIEAHPTQYAQDRNGLVDIHKNKYYYVTPCCVATWACLLSNPTHALGPHALVDMAEYPHLYDKAAALIGCTPWTELFHAGWPIGWLPAAERPPAHPWGAYFFTPTAGEAVGVLRRLARKEIAL